MGAGLLRRRGLGVGDPRFALRSSILHLDGANGATTGFTDQKGLVWTGAGGAPLSTAQQKFGTASLSLNGSNQFIKTPFVAGGGFDFGAGDFTLEGWVRPANVASNMTIMSNWYGVAAGNCAWLLYMTASGKLQLSYGIGGLNTGTPSLLSLTANVWQFVRAWRTGGNIRYQIGDTVDSTVVAIGSGALNTAPGGSIAIGCSSPDTGASLYFNGYVDEMRATKGYAETGPAPTAPWLDA